MARRNIVLTHVGTSIIGRHSPLYEPLHERVEQLVGEHGAHALEQTGHDAPLTGLLDDCDAILDTLEDEKVIAMSAELKSLEHIRRRVGPLDEVVLIATDTPRGVLAARLDAHVLARRHPDARIVVERIDGLQVADARRFASVGLQQYIKFVTETLREKDPSWARVILNPTGGFKSVVPYATMLAALYEIEAHYIHEFSDALLTLQPLPITYDTSFADQHLDAMAWLAEQEDEGVSEEQLCEQFGVEPPIEQSTIAPLVELFDEDVWLLSGLGAILLEQYSTQRQPIMLSRAAQKDLAGASIDLRRVMLESLERMSDPGRRRAGLHPPYRRNESDSPCYGRRHSPTRVHFFEQDGAVYVMRIFSTSRDHDLRDKLLFDGSLMRANFGGWEPLEDHR